MNQNMMSIEETSFLVESPRIAGVATGGFLLIIFFVHIGGMSMMQT